MVSFNMWHAIHGGIPFLLAVLYGLAPVTLAMGLSHVVGAYRGGWFMKGTTFAIMLGAMVLSVRATGYVVRPATGQMWPLFGAVVDSAALVALQVILSPESRAAAKAARRATAEAIQEAVPQATESAIQEPLPGPAGEPVPVPAKRPAVSQRPKAIRISKDPEAEQARADYRKSLRQNQPLSDRALGEKYGRSRSWGAARIREIEAGPRLAGTGSLC